MKLAIFQIDAFSDKVFGGNPACVVPLENWLQDEVLLKIAQENAVAETAFFVRKGKNYHLRWFTPDIEMDLCGHATLASAHCILSELKLESEKVIFETVSGELEVSIKNESYLMDLPRRDPISATLPNEIKNALNIQPKKILKARDYVLVYENQKEIEDIVIDREVFDQININPGGVIVTAKGNNCDFISRFFTPQATILEDPVTGSAHCTLTPYWSKILKKTKMNAKQISKRKGELICELKKNRVKISGKAVTFSVGNLFII
ncbi:MAG: PhzF family phenazine biosynthesis protein [Flavobacteriales bacterium]|nr:PhzF family phenazine biosynthesis protein [Flavobacteriales bacterium]|tara:strand:- start:470 stop:1258 length:789 start_codon:yes stop_codon:yes gene_type:complete